MHERNARIEEKTTVMHGLGKYSATRGHALEASLPATLVIANMRDLSITGKYSLLA